MNYLLDTCIISEYLKKKPSEEVIGWLDQQDERSLYLSCLVIAELQKGYYQLQKTKPVRENKARAIKISNWIQRIEKRFEGRIVAIDSKLLNAWSSLCGSAEAGGKKLPVIDSLIAVTAQLHGMVIVTRNVDDFRNCYEGLEIFDPY
ncbi:MAG: type II toxin-antitoxin system VapC family toxin [Pseudomonadales bacterium]